MNDQDLANAVRDAAPTEVSAPAFDKVWANAEARYHQSRSRYSWLAGAAAAVAAAVIVLNIGEFYICIEAVVSPVVSPVPLPREARDSFLAPTGRALRPPPQHPRNGRPHQADSRANLPPLGRLLPKSRKSGRKA